MGKRGIKPQPKAIAVQKGLYRPSRHDDPIGDSEKLPFVHNTLPAPPDELDDFGKKTWNDILADAQKLYGYISFIDLKQFKEYCRTYSLVELLYAGGDVITADAQTWRRYESATKRLDRLAASFGFTPGDRTRIKLEQKETKTVDEFDNEEL